MPTINDSIIKSEKKSKRKHQDPEPESEPTIEPIKKEKKKKKNKQKDENEPSVNGSEVELTEKKKKKKKPKTEQEPDVNVVVGGVDEVRQSEDNVVVSGKDINDSKYKALTTFSESNLSDELLECCKNFAKPSPIQSNSWPFLLHGRDFIGIAKTGSGKTLAFGIPAMNHILNKRKNNTSKKVTPLVLALAPTRELAQQLKDDFTSKTDGLTSEEELVNGVQACKLVGSKCENTPFKQRLLVVANRLPVSAVRKGDACWQLDIYDVISEAGKPSGVRSLCVYGGTSKGPQISALKSGVDIVVGTPGRLRDLIEMGVCQLQDVSFVVLDEADRMLDMGFEPEVRSILSKTNSVRQVVMFSATWPLAVHQLAQEFMDPNPVKVVIGSEDLAANHDVLQIVEVLEDNARDGRLIELLEKYHKSRSNRVLVFVLYKKEASRVENMLQRRGWKAVSISGDKAQRARTEALQLFKDGTSPLLIATDVAARGLDIPDVEVVINYSFPLTTEDYVHRIGRTGRAGKKGVAHTFFMKENKGLSGELINVLREAGQNVPNNLLNFGTHVKKKESKIYGAHFKEISADAPKATKITFGSDDEED